MFCKTCWGLSRFPQSWQVVLIILGFDFLLNLSFAVVIRKLEDINVSLYLVKCDAVLNRSRHRQGEKQRKMTKFCNGICLFFILIFVIWTPILMYNSGNPTNIANPINDAVVQFDIKTDEGGLTLYQTTLCERIPWGKLNDISSLDPNGYLDTYSGNDIQLICCQADASAMCRFW